MMSMFRHAYAFNQDVSSWDISRVESMNRMFEGAKLFNRDLCKWGQFKKFPYDHSSYMFDGSYCKYKDKPERENGGPFCASDCKS
jgi:surface protein